MTAFDGAAFAVRGVVAVLAVGYPAPFRGAVLGQAYAAIDAPAILVTAAAFVRWDRLRMAPRPEHACALLIALLEIALFGGPYSPKLPDPFSSWYAAQLVYLVTWGVLLAVHAGARWSGFLMLYPSSPARRGEPH
jgi:hypothetical protein